MIEGDTAKRRAALAAGFREPVFDSQSSFRALMDAMAHPGSLYPLAPDLCPPRPLQTAAGALLLTLADYETPVWLDPDLIAADNVCDWIRFHTGAVITKHSHEARFAVFASGATLPSLSLFPAGSQEFPDESATLIIQTDTLHAGSGPLLTGPGIESGCRLDPAPLTPLFWRQAVDNAALFPRGVDVVFAAPGAIAALPRSTRIELDA